MNKRHTSERQRQIQRRVGLWVRLEGPQEKGSVRIWLPGSPGSWQPWGRSRCSQGVWRRESGGEVLLEEKAWPAPPGRGPAAGVTVQGLWPAQRAPGGVQEAEGCSLTWGAPAWWWQQQRWSLGSLVQAWQFDRHGPSAAWPRVVSPGRHRGPRWQLEPTTGSKLVQEAGRGGGGVGRQRDPEPGPEAAAASWGANLEQRQARRGRGQEHSSAGWGGRRCDYKVRWRQHKVREREGAAGGSLWGPRGDWSLATERRPPAAGDRPSRTGDWCSGPSAEPAPRPEGGSSRPPPRSPRPPPIRTPASSRPGSPGNH